MLTPNTTGHHVLTSHRARPGESADGAGFVSAVYEVVSWQELPDGQVVPLVVGPDDTIVDGTTLDGYSGLYAGHTQLAPAPGWYAEFLGLDGTPFRRPLAAWTTWHGDVVGLTACQDGEVADGRVVNSGDVELYIPRATNFVRYVHSSELMV